MKETKQIHSQKYTYLCMELSQFRFKYFDEGVLVDANRNLQEKNGGKICKHLLWNNTITIISSHFSQVIAFWLKLLLIEKIPLTSNHGKM